MTMQKVRNSYVFSDAETIAAERVRRRGLRRFLGSQAILAAAFGLSVIEAGANAAATEDDFQAQADEASDDTSSALPDAMAARAGVDVDEETGVQPEPDDADASVAPAAPPPESGAIRQSPVQPDSPAREAAPDAAGGGGGGGGSARAEGGADVAPGGLSLGSSTPPAPSGDGATVISSPALEVGLDLGLDIPRLIDLGEGTSLVVEVTASLPLLPEIGLSLDALSADGDQIRLEAVIGEIGGEIGVGAALTLPALEGDVEDVADIAEPLLQEVARPALEAVSHPPVVDLLAGTGDIAGGETIRLAEKAITPAENPLFAGLAHTDYGVTLNAEDPLAAIGADPVGAPPQLADVADLEALGQMDDGGLPGSSPLSLLTH